MNGTRRPRRADREGAHRIPYERNRKRILASENVCALCGKPVDKSLKFPHPMSATVDHIIPINKGGHPSDIDNLQLCHNICNQRKGQSIKQSIGDLDPTNHPNPKYRGGGGRGSDDEIITNRDLPKVRDWSQFKRNH